MKIELNQNKVYFNNGSVKKEIHPFWLRERVDGEEFLDKGTQQRLFDPTTLSSEISINTATINKQFLEIYFYGALAGGLLFIFSYNVFPVFENSFTPLIGSSAAVYSLLIFACSYYPNTSVSLIFFNVKLKHIGLFYVLMSLIQIPFNNAGGNIAHLGGAIYGLYYSNNFNSFKSPFNIITDYIDKFSFKSSNKKNDQKTIDEILDKISKSGYESLTKHEKDLLFKNSDKN